MIGLLVTAAYVLGAVLAFPRLYAAFVRYHRDEWPSLSFEDSDRLAGMFFCSIAAALWPLVLIGRAAQPHAIAALRKLEDAR